MSAITFEEEAEFMVLFTKYDYDAAIAYLVSQDAYFDILGLNVNEEEEMNQFISERTGISIEVCEQFSEANLKFLEKND